MNGLQTTYGPDGFYWILCWDEDQTISFLQNYFTTNGWTPTELYQDTSDAVFGQYSSAYNGGSGGHPQHYLIDRDKDVRKTSIGAIDGSPATEWTNAVKELVGVS